MQPQGDSDHRNPSVIAKPTDNKNPNPIPSGEIAKAVREQLCDDFPPEALGWVDSIPWSGPQRLDLSKIDWSAVKSWQAFNELDRVDKFAQQIKNGWDKPIVTVQVPGDDRVRIVDGHHRALAYATLKRPLLAYVGQVPKKVGPWDYTHASQYSGPSIKGLTDTRVKLADGSEVLMTKQLRNALAMTLDLGTADVQTPTGLAPGKQPTPAIAPKLKKKKQTRISAKLGPGGSLNVRHMFDGGEKTVKHAGEALFLAKLTDDKAPVWNQIAITGAWKGHPQGPFVIDSQTLSEIVRNFNATQNRNVPIDYEHASEQDPTSGSIPQNGAPAIGHIKQLEIRDGALWGLVEWTDKARSQIANGEYKFFSPAIRFNSRDRTTGQRIGAVLSSGALTNKPFLDGMAAMAASEAAGETLTTVLEFIDERIAVAIASDEPETTVVDQTTLTDPTDGVITMATDDKNEKNEEKLSTLKTNVAELTIRLTSVETECARQKQRADLAEAELKTMRDAQFEAEVDEVIERHAKDRGYSAAIKPHLLSLLSSNPDGFRAMHPKPEAKDKAKLFTTVVQPERREDPRAILSELNNETVSMTTNRLMRPKAEGGEGLPYARALAMANQIHSGR